jgi:hypothetical protein
MVNAAVSVFLRAGRLYVTPLSGGEGFYFQDGEPLALEPLAPLLAEALPGLFAQSVFPKEPPDYHTHSAAKLPALAGLERYADFDKGAKNVDVRRSDEGYALTENQRLRGGERFGRVVEHRPLGVTDAELAEWILGWLAKAR